MNHPGFDHRTLDQAVAHLNGNSGEAPAAQLSDFINAMQSYASSPSNSSLAAAAVTAAGNLTTTLNEATHDLFLQGSVRIVQGARKINAQSVVYNTVTAKAHAEGDVTMQFPGQLHRGLATPKPLHVPKNGFTQDVTPAPRPS